MTNPEQPATRCVLPHKRRRDPGEVFTLPDGTETAADGTEVVWDHEAPRLASWGGSYLCNGHLARLRTLLARTPVMVSWLRQHVQPGAHALDPDTPKAAPGKRSPAPCDLTAVDAADEEVAALASWVLMVAEERDEQPPDLSGVWMVPASRQVDETHRVQVAGAPRAVGLRVARDVTATPAPAVARSRYFEPPRRRPGVRCDLSDLLVTECACQIHRFDSNERCQA